MPELLSLGIFLTLYFDFSVLLIILYCISALFSLGSVQSTVVLSFCKYSSVRIFPMPVLVFLLSSVNCTIILNPRFSDSQFSLNVVPLLTSFSYELLSSQHVFYALSNVYAQATNLCFYSNSHRIILSCPF
jgi:hypothetical protein